MRYFVNQYVLVPAATGGKHFGVTTEGIENIPAGWRVRETYAIVEPDEFFENFELTAPGAEFEMYSEAKFWRKKSSDCARCSRPRAARGTASS
jgi:hypothetical protein